MTKSECTNNFTFFRMYALVRQYWLVTILMAYFDVTFHKCVSLWKYNFKYLEKITEARAVKLPVAPQKKEQRSRSISKKLAVLPLLNLEAALHRAPLRPPVYMVFRHKMIPSLRIACNYICWTSSPTKFSVVFYFKLRIS